MPKIPDERDVLTENAKLKEQVSTLKASLESTARANVQAAAATAAAKPDDGPVDGQVFGPRNQWAGGSSANNPVILNAPVTAEQIRLCQNLKPVPAALKQPTAPKSTGSALWDQYEALSDAYASAMFWEAHKTELMDEARRIQSHE